MQPDANPVALILLFMLLCTVFELTIRKAETGHKKERRERSWRAIEIVLGVVKLLLYAGLAYFLNSFSERLPGGPTSVYLPLDTSIAAFFIIFVIDEVIPDKVLHKLPILSGMDEFGMQKARKYFALFLIILFVSGICCPYISNSTSMD